MSAAIGLGIRCTGALILDRETGKAYALHAGACLDRFEAAMGAAGVSMLERFAPMGPAVLAAGEACDLRGCEVTR